MATHLPKPICSDSPSLVLQTPADPPDSTLDTSLDAKLHAYLHAANESCLRQGFCELAPACYRSCVQHRAEGSTDRCEARCVEWSDGDAVQQSPKAISMPWGG